MRTYSEMDYMTQLPAFKIEVAVCYTCFWARASENNWFITCVVYAPIVLQLCFSMLYVSAKSELDVTTSCHSHNAGCHNAARFCQGHCLAHCHSTIKNG